MFPYNLQYDIKKKTRNEAGVVIQRTSDGDSMQLPLRLEFVLLISFRTSKTSRRCSCGLSGGKNCRQKQTKIVTETSSRLKISVMIEEVFRGSYNYLTTWYRNSEGSHLSFSKKKNAALLKINFSTWTKFEVAVANQKPSDRKPDSSTTRLWYKKFCSIIILIQKISVCIPVCLTSSRKG